MEFFTGLRYNGQCILGIVIVTITMPCVLQCFTGKNYGGNFHWAMLYSGQSEVFQWAVFLVAVFQWTVFLLQKKASII